MSADAYYIQTGLEKVSKSIEAIATEMARARLANTTQFRIWSLEHGAWWKSNRCGYTPYLIDAGIYTQEEAMEICLNANAFVDVVHEAMVPVR